ncbi:hypothetical protein ARMSODRAFT_975926 [Armillaria solidipes]|uniref:Uncharacterized protein n=1 Tax=Armillaria solidipes TaxID=1076256 RepID=A0A2H3BZQ5_9AGAR|nr:hypothetical protein ARMSODRAFT_975926 [Armillaria solidipes]
MAQGGRTTSFHADKRTIASEHFVRNEFPIRVCHRPDTIFLGVDLPREIKSGLVMNEDLDLRLWDPTPEISRSGRMELMTEMYARRHVSDVWVRLWYITGSTTGFDDQEADSRLSYKRKSLSEKRTQQMHSSNRSWELEQALRPQGYGLWNIGLSSKVSTYQVLTL